MAVHLLFLLKKLQRMNVYTTVCPVEQIRGATKKIFFHRAKKWSAIYTLAEYFSCPETNIVAFFSSWGQNYAVYNLHG